jgi:hypothetical protein
MDPHPARRCAFLDNVTDVLLRKFCVEAGSIYLAEFMRGDWERLHVGVRVVRQADMAVDNPVLCRAVGRIWPGPDLSARGRSAVATRRKPSFGIGGRSQLGG